MKNNRLLKTLEKEILLYALSNSNNTTARCFITRVFGYLRANLDLLENKDYKKLYDECLIFLKWSNSKDLKYKNIPDKLYEIVADIMLNYYGLQYDKGTVENYLKFRIEAWNSGYYDKLFE